MNKMLFLLAVLLTGCANEPIPLKAELPILDVPAKPAFTCTEIKWYYINEHLAISLIDFKKLLKCEAANKAYSKTLLEQVNYYREGVNK